MQERKYGHRYGCFRAFTINEFCHRNNVGRTTAYAEIKAGRLRARRVGKKKTIITDDDEAAWREALPNLRLGES